MINNYFYNRLHGSYEALKGGTTSEAMEVKIVQHNRPIYTILAKKKYAKILNHHRFKIDSIPRTLLEELVRCMS